VWGAPQRAEHVNAMPSRYLRQDPARLDLLACTDAGLRDFSKWSRHPGLVTEPGAASTAPGSHVHFFPSLWSLVASVTGPGVAPDSPAADSLLPQPSARRCRFAPRGAG